MIRMTCHVRQISEFKNVPSKARKNSHSRVSVVRSASLLLGVLIVLLSYVGCGPISGRTAIPPPDSSIRITPTQLPSGKVESPYQTSLTASGGKRPYTWSVVSGSIPSGLLLDSATGAILGTPSETGAFSLRIQVSDMDAHSSSSSFIIQISSASTTITPSAASCGGPPVYCARSDRDLVPETPMAAPEVNEVFTDPDFGSRMVRVTDADVLVNMGLSNINYVTDSSGEQNTWNTDSTRFYVIGTGGNFLLYSFDPATMQAAWEPIPGAINGALPVGNVTFSRTNPNIVYGEAESPDQVIAQYDISANNLTDLIATTSCVPGLAASSHMGDVSVSAGDQLLLTYQGGKQQDTDMFVVVYEKSLGCRWYNTRTGEIGGQWGPVGKATSGASFLMHNARISMSGDWAVLDSSTSALKFFWQVGTLNVNACGISQAPYCGGHNVGGNINFVNSSGLLDDMNIMIRPFDNLDSSAELINPLPKAVQWGFDKHLSWNDDNSTDTMPVCGSTFLEENGSRAINRAWNREIFCLRTDGIQSQVWRFGHNRSVYQAADFWSTPRGNVSQDGKFYMFTSTWENQLGPQPGMPGRFREDVFIIELH
jgi:hypothetical protein